MTTIRDLNNDRSANSFHAQLGLVALFAGTMITAIWVGIAMPVDTDRRYDLIQYTGEESDIIDYNLTSSDCGHMLSKLRASGYDVECETPAK